MDDHVPQFVLVLGWILDRGTWYVCPAEKRAEAEAYFEEAARYWKRPHPALPKDMLPGPPAIPDYLVPVGPNLARLRFTGYTID